MSSQNFKTFEDVHREEICGPIHERRKFHREECDEERTYPESDGKDLVGVALSGGGIRSAMFNLGLLQAFKNSGLMKHVDILSSVSGGGYTNGYYSVLGHFSKKHDGKPKKNDEEGPVHGLSARDAQFLLDGQYLNRPIEFLTDYLMKTFVMLATAFCIIVAFSCMVALYFRAFDYPAVRDWLGLLDIDSDLEVGLFASIVLGACVLFVRLVVLTICSVLRRPIVTSPGQWALILMGVMMIGGAVMIGNGDFYISDGTGFLPAKVDFRSLQLPLIAASLILLSPIFKVGKLLQSEKVTASVWQKAVLWLVLVGTSWGLILGVISWIGKENISGFVTHRTPALAEHDIKDYRAFYNFVHSLSVDLQIPPNIRENLENLVPSTVESGNATGNKSLLLAAMENRDKYERILRPESLKWDSWRNVKLQAMSRYSKSLVVGIEAADDAEAKNFLKAEKAIREHGYELAKKFDDLINPHPDMIDSEKDRKKRLDQVTIHLIRLAAKRLPKTEDQAKSLREENGDESRICTAIIEAWINKGGSIVSSDLPNYRELGNFSRLFRKCLVKESRYSLEVLTAVEGWQFRRMLLEISHPDIFKQRTWISTSNVIQEDQSFRMAVGLAATLMAILGICVLDLNRLSPWYLFYRSRISETFLKKANEDGAMKLRALNPTEKGYPYPLFIASLLLPQAPSYQRIVKKKSRVANSSKMDESFASPWYSFLLSPLYCGWLPTGKQANRKDLVSYRSTKEYMSGELGVADAIALSGAAITSFMANNRSLSALMLLFNIRLEQWLPNPLSKSQPPNLSFNAVDLGREIARQSNWSKESWRFGVVADGGFREFLGVEELIARRSRIIIASDAGCNNGLYEFGVLADLIRKLRLDHSVEILDLDHDRPLDTARLKRSETLHGRSPQHFVIGRIRYPDLETRQGTAEPIDNTKPMFEGLFIYIQMSLTGDEDIDIEQFRRTNPNFPDEPISNQFYSQDQVESFRQLGEHIGRMLCRDITPFDCPNDNDSVAYRIRKLEDGFRSSYRSECRQEATLANDDADMGWMLDVNKISDSTLEAIAHFENDANYQLRIRDYVWRLIDDCQIDAKDSQIAQTDIYGIAIECNRRHAGFRREWPTSFFQVTGRDLLIRATEIASKPITDDEKAEINAWMNCSEEQFAKLGIPTLVKKISKLGILLKRGVFRREGGRTAAEVIACILHHYANLLCFSPPRDWYFDAGVQKSLRKAINSGNAREFEKTIANLVHEHVIKVPKERKSSQISWKADDGEAQ